MMRVEVIAKRYFTAGSRKGIMTEVKWNDDSGNDLRVGTVLKKRGVNRTQYEDTIISIRKQEKTNA